MPIYSVHSYPWSIIWDVDSSKGDMYFVLQVDLDYSGYSRKLIDRIYNVTCKRAINFIGILSLKEENTGNAIAFCVLFLA